MQMKNRLTPSSSLSDFARTAILCSLLVVGLGSSGYSQSIESVPAEKSKSERKPKRLPDRVVEVPTPPPVPIKADPEPDPRSPDQIIEDFFGALEADKVEAAYDSLSNQIALRDRGPEADQLRVQTQQALDAYGPVRGYELISEEWAGKNLSRRTYLLLGEVLPLRWRFYFYKSSTGWNLIDLRVDDAIVDLFDESQTP